jgi:hypothetical protein
MSETQQPKIEYDKLAPGYEFPPASFRLDGDKVAAYLAAVEDKDIIYQEDKVVPPMAVAALSMAAMAAALTLPPGAIHVSQGLEFTGAIAIGEELTSHARVVRKVARGKFHMLNIGIKVLNRSGKKVLSGETGFILPQAAEEK